jgi:hypothetical protein
LILPENFSAKFSKILPAGAYTVTGSFDDNLRIIVDGNVIYDSWTGGSITRVPISQTFSLFADTPVSIEYAELTGIATLGLQITGPGVANQPFMTPNTPIAQINSSLNTNPNAWKMQTFAAPGNVIPLAALPANSMNLGIIAPIDVAVDGNSVFIQDLWGYTYEVDSGGQVLNQFPHVVDSKAIAVANGDLFVLSGPCGIVQFHGPSTGPIDFSLGCVPGGDATHFDTEIRDIASDGSSLFVLDKSHIWRFSFSAGTSISWRYTNVLTNPTHLAVLGDVGVVADNGLTKLAGMSGNFTTTLTEVSLQFPLTVSPVGDVRGLAMLNNNLVLFTEFDTHVVRMMNLSTNQVTHVAGVSGQPETPYLDATNLPNFAGTGKLYEPQGIAASSHGIYVAQGGHALVKRIHQ